MKRSTIAVINKNNIRFNFRRIKVLAPNSKVMAIVKANAYGHGIDEVAKVLYEENVDMFGVAFVDEAVRIRELGIKTPILVFFPSNDEESELICKHNLQVVASSYRTLEALSKVAVKHNVRIKAHLFIETGMNREGISHLRAPEFMKKCSNLENIDINGVCTHFATAPNNIEFAQKQLDIFLKTLNNLKQDGYKFEYVHASNSAGIVNLPQAHFNIVRPGMSLYGYPPEKHLLSKLQVRPVMTLKTNVFLTHRIKKGDSVGYSQLYVADKDTTIATLPIGYGDGYPRTLTGKGECLINGKRYDIVGSVCMDACMVDVGDDDVKLGDEVILIGNQGSETITAFDIAEKIGSIPYEITTAISARVPRTYM